MQDIDDELVRTKEVRQAAEEEQAATPTLLPFAFEGLQSVARGSVTTPAAPEQVAPAVGPSLYEAGLTAEDITGRVVRLADLRGKVGGGPVRWLPTHVGCFGLLLRFLCA